VTTSSLNVSSSYFTMPPMVTPQMLAQQPQAKQVSVETKKSYAPPAPEPEEPQLSMAARQAEMLLATQAAAAPKPRTVAPKPAVTKSAPHVSPIRSIPPVSSAAASDTNANDIRVTQLSPSTGAASALSSQGAQRSQSLFKRITGFGLVRPSCEEAEAEVEEAKPAEQPRLGIDVTDRPTLSAQDPEDLLDIPAFLRRQTNH
jgi:cell division protein FtsZ